MNDEKTTRRRFLVATIAGSSAIASGLGLSAEALACRLVQFAAAGMRSLSGSEHYTPASTVPHATQPTT